MNISLKELLHSVSAPAGMLVQMLSLHLHKLLVPTQPLPSRACRTTSHTLHYIIREWLVEWGAFEGGMKALDLHKPSQTQNGEGALSWSIVSSLGY